MNLCRFCLQIFKATTQSSIRSQTWSQRSRLQGSALSITKCWTVDLEKPYASCTNNCTKKLCVLSGNFRTWMIDVLPQIINTIKETYNLQSYDPKISVNTELYWDHLKYGYDELALKATKSNMNFVCNFSWVKILNCVFIVLVKRKIVQTKIWSAKHNNPLLRSTYPKNKTIH